MESKDILTVLGLIATNGALLFGMWKYFDQRISRVYERFDEHKEEIKNEFVKKESCDLLHNNTANNLRGVENRMDARFDKLETKVESAFAMILDLLKK
jgi:hypothetical protein